MDVRLGLSLLLLLAHSSDAICKNARDGPSTSPRIQNHRLHRQTPRQTRELSEYLVPPPAPNNLRGPPRGPPSPLPPPIQPKPIVHNQPPPSPLPPPPPHSPPKQQHSRNGRYVNQQGGNGNGGPGYFSKLMNWLNPFGGGTGDKDSQGASNFQRATAQYAPHQPYTSGIGSYEPPPHPANIQNSYSNLASWMSGKSCNPCNQVPWIPVLRDNFHENHGQYSSNIDSNAYLAPPPPQEVKPPDYSQSGPIGSPSVNQHYPIPNPHLYPGSMPPLFKAKPFNDGPVNHPPPNLNEPPALNLNQQSPENFDHQFPPNFDNQGPSNFDHQGPPNFDHQGPPNFDHQGPPNFDQQGPPNFDHTSNFGNTQIFDHSSGSNYNAPSPQNYDQPPQNFDDHSSSNFHQSPNIDYPSSLNYDNQSPSIYEDQHPPSNSEQHHQPSQIVGIVKEPPSNLHESEVKNRQEPDHAESRPVFVNSATSNSNPQETISIETDHLYHPQATTISPKDNYKKYGNVHFQRSPVIDLSVTGEASTTVPPNQRVPSESNNRFRDRPTDQPVTITALKGKPRESSTRPATVIDYIVSSPEEVFGLSEEEKETRPPPRLQSEKTVTPPSTTTTTQRVTTIPVDESRQESFIETLVQSYEFYKKKNDTMINETQSGGRIFNDSEDFSASREIITPDKLDNGKKNKQIIIPYTSQYTPSPFHPTRKIDGNGKKFDQVGSPSSTITIKKEKTSLKDIDIDDNVEDNVVIQESRRVPVTQQPDRLRKNQTDSSSKTSNAIDVHRLQKNIDNWTIQEYSKTTTSITNSTYPRWLSSKQIPNEYLLSAAELAESIEYYDFSNETELLRGINKSEVTTTSRSITKVNIINATYPKNRIPNELPKRNNTDPKSRDAERVYVVTPIPNPNSLEDTHNSVKDLKKLRTRKPKVKHQQKGSISVERAYQVLPQAVNNLAVMSSAPDSAAPALWGIMEHEEIAASADQPRWRSESDSLPEPVATPVLYAGHSKVSRAR